MKKLLLLLIVGMFLLTTVSATIWDSNTKQYYKFDETSGTNAVDSTENINGTANNAQVFSTGVNGILQTGADTTNGGHYINFGDISWIDSTDSLTISAWVNFSSLSARSPFIVKSDAILADDTVFVLEIKDASRFRFLIRDSNNVNDELRIDPSWLSTTEYTHIVAVANSTTMQLWINNNLTNSTSRSGGANFNPNSKNFTIGRYGGYDGYYSNVLIFELLPKHSLFPLDHKEVLARRYIICLSPLNLNLHSINQLHL